MEWIRREWNVNWRKKQFSMKRDSLEVSGTGSAHLKNLSAATSGEANKVAHLIAKEGLQKKETTYLQNMFTFGVEEALNEDRRREESLQD
ncbi:hypothetical protein PVK06_020582 [Gossypium arboreum]|uniref:Uncharacterized protein n=1 Tax=Gossypium arboreum TaxID=29729 RepID=A0ABR0PMR1_GOSAR|nr:hypothetical protein PVK06_020582 [Gossypium arboreum]